MHICMRLEFCNVYLSCMWMCWWITVYRPLRVTLCIHFDPGWFAGHWSLLIQVLLRKCSSPCKTYGDNHIQILKSTLWIPLITIQARYLKVHTLNLTHWGRVTLICVSKLTIIVSDNGLSPCRRQAIIWTNAGILLIGPLGTNFNETSIEIHTFSFKKPIWKCRLENCVLLSRPPCVNKIAFSSEEYNSSDVLNVHIKHFNCPYGSQRTLNMQYNVN